MALLRAKMTGGTPEKDAAANKRERRKMLILSLIPLLAVVLVIVFECIFQSQVRQFTSGICDNQKIGDTMSAMSFYRDADAYAAGAYLAAGNVEAAKAVDTEIIYLNQEALDNGVRGWDHLRGIVLVENVTEVADYAFEGCSGMTWIDIPESVVTIGKYAFSDCVKLVNVVIPDSVKSVGESAFYNCNKLTWVTLSSEMTVIQPYTFDKCTSLTGVGMPEGMQEIAQGAFRDCKDLSSVVVPMSVTKIGSAAFSGTEADIKCDALSQPESWDSDWLAGSKCTVKWDAKPK